MKKNEKLFLAFTFLNMAIAIALGAMGAHALKKILATKQMETFLTGNRYQFYIGISLILFYLLEKSIPNLNLKVSKTLALLGLIGFSLGCYLYAMTGIKIFVHIVPLGGLCFIFSWLWGFKETIKLDV